MDTIKLWSYLLLYLGVGTILGAAVMLMTGSFDIAMATGGVIAVVGAAIFAVTQLRRLRAQGKATDHGSNHEAR